MLGFPQSPTGFFTSRTRGLPVSGDTSIPLSRKGRGKRKSKTRSVEMKLSVDFCDAACALTPTCQSLRATIIRRVVGACFEPLRTGGFTVHPSVVPVYQIQMLHFVMDHVSG